LWGFLAVTVPLVLVPGASTAVVLRNSIAGGVRAGIETAIGINAGSFCYGLLSAFGVALVLNRWPAAWTVLRLAGVAYLAWLGWRSISRAFARVLVSPVTLERGTPRDAVRNAYEGLVTNLLNPAIATFYIAVLPQFVPRHAPPVRSVLLLTLVHISVAISWHIAWAIAGGTLSGVLAGGRPRQALEFVSGAALVALALRMALQPFA
jgi:threonine/homoserine/homoserine lactone efflux protein